MNAEKRREILIEAGFAGVQDHRTDKFFDLAEKAAAEEIFNKIESGARGHDCFGISNNCVWWQELKKKFGVD